MTATTRLGPYEILAPLGAGGMGEVYRALDTRLQREVAIKVLPAERTSGETQRWQFMQEARAASALNHPHIVTIHEIESVDGVDFMVMECVPGTTLDALISRNGMAVHELLRVAIPIADALAAAHEHGIVHSDLKPANVIVSHQGQVKVLDFGLAQFIADGNVDDSLRTVTMPGSEQRIAAGTPPYMSPEQASGRELDARSDIFSFGAMLYEMATGRRAFGRGSMAETLAAVLKDDPRPPHELTPGIPDALDGIILRCLKKDPARRFQHASDIKVQLEEVRGELGRPRTGTARRPQYPRLVLASIALVALVSAAAAVRSRDSAAPPPTVQPLTSERWAGAGSFSPDGTQIAYASAGDDGANWDIRLKIVGETGAKRLTTDLAGEGYPAWSPDGTQIAFLRFHSGTTRWPSRFAIGTVHVVSPLGGLARPVSDFPATLQLAWSPDGRWLAASKAQSGNEPPGGIHLLSVATGEVRAVTFPPAHSYDLSPAFSPDGRELAYAACQGVIGTPTCELRVVQLDAEGRPSGPARTLPGARTTAPELTWVRDGRSVVYGAGSLWRVRTDGKSLPEPVPLAGRATSPCFSANGSRLAFVDPAVGGDIYRIGADGAARPVVRSSAFDMQPQYSPDGHRIVLSSAGAGASVREVWLADADGSNLTRLTRGPGHFQGYPGWSPDGSTVVFESKDEKGTADVWTIKASGSGLRQVTRNAADDILPSFSRDGRFIYFSSSRTGRYEVWRVAAGGGPEEQVTRNGGVFPFESWDGRTLYYLSTFIDGPLLGRPTAGGDEHTVLRCATAHGYAAGPHGIFHYDCGNAAQRGSLRHFDAASRHDRLVARLDADFIGGLTVAPDGKTLAYGRGEATANLMMIENFR